MNARGRDERARRPSGPTATAVNSPSRSGSQNEVTGVPPEMSRARRPSNAARSGASNKTSLFDLANHSPVSSGFPKMKDASAWSICAARSPGGRSRLPTTKSLVARPGLEPGTSRRPLPPPFPGGCTPSWWGGFRREPSPLSVRDPPRVPARRVLLPSELSGLMGAAGLEPAPRRALLSACSR